VPDSPTTGWPVFLYWARKFYESPQFEEAERNYKFRAVRPLKLARKGLLSGSDWVKDVERGFTNTDNNLVSHWQFRPFLQWVRDDRAAARDAIWRLWTEDDLNAAARLDGFSLLLPKHVLSGSGGRCNLAVYLLGAIDPIRWPNYRVTPIKLAYELTRYLAPEPPLSMGRIYSHALEFFDRLRAEAAAMDLVLEDRLDAQGVMWSVVHWQKRPPNFSTADWQQLLEFRAVRIDRTKPRQRAKQARVRRSRAPVGRPLCPLCALDEEVVLVGRTDKGWLYVCETGPGHEEPYEFPFTPRLI
jgi:hypothetical protein